MGATRVASTTDVWLDVRDSRCITALLRGLHPRLHVVNTVFRGQCTRGSAAGPLHAQPDRGPGSPKYDASSARAAGSGHGSGLLGGGVLHANWPENFQVVNAACATVRELSESTAVRHGPGPDALAGDPSPTWTTSACGAVPAPTPPGFPGVRRRLPPRRGLPRANPGPAGRRPGRSGSAPADDRGRPRKWCCACPIRHLGRGSAREDAEDRPRPAAAVGSAPRIRALPGGHSQGTTSWVSTAAGRGGTGRVHPLPSRVGRDFTFGPRQVLARHRFHHHLIAALHGAGGLLSAASPGYC
ncbi:hypothetical protein QJS66_16375 [Kocuria rhizophila]|nr:hypothetical protein QJS66_16375 [Kocuria rhizophila]